MYANLIFAKFGHFPKLQTGTVGLRLPVCLCFKMLKIDPAFQPYIKCVVGCFCVYSDVASFEYIRSSLEKTLLSNLEKDDGLPFQVLK